MDHYFGELSHLHSTALRWFAENTDSYFDKRPIDVGIGVNVSDARRGIWKPAKIDYPISVVQTHGKHYKDADLPPQFNTDGTWTCIYSQQGRTEDELRFPENNYLNRGLLRCMHEGVPVGVIMPGRGKGYVVLGLGLIKNYVFGEGLFVIEGPVFDPFVSEPTITVSDEPGLITAEVISWSGETFDPYARSLERKTVLKEIARRQGQPRFRQQLLHAYEGKCAFSSFDSPPCLEAAHIIPYAHSQTNHPANGLLLRADLHTLFDMGLMAVDTSSQSLLISNHLSGTKYEDLADQKIWVPRNPALRPSVDALDLHRDRSLA